jgi:hypothetical protein
MRNRILGLMAVLVLAFAFAAPAMGQNATEDAYSPIDDRTQGISTDTVNAATTTTNSTDTSDSLPFTGFEAGLVALIGAGLVGTGFAVRRVSRGGTVA